jgi:hypothetical protein
MKRVWRRILLIELLRLLRLLRWMGRGVVIVLWYDGVSII